MMRPRNIQLDFSIQILEKRFVLLNIFSIYNKNINKVNRLNLMFEHEDPEFFEKRLELATTKRNFNLSQRFIKGFNFSFK